MKHFPLPLFINQHNHIDARRHRATNGRPSVQRPVPARSAQSLGEQRNMISYQLSDQKHEKGDDALKYEERGLKREIR